MGKNKGYYPNCDATIWLRSCKKEIIKPIKGKASGTIPFWINGSLYRNGPGLLEIGDCRVGHLFDGLGLLHKFSIKNGTVTYQCRFLRSNTYKRNIKANRIVVTDFGTKSVPDPCQTIFHRIASTFKWGGETSDNAMVSIYPFGDELYALSEMPYIHKINKNNLQTEGRIDLKEKMGVVCHSSHPHVMSNGTVYSLAVTASVLGPQHNIVCFPNKPKNHVNDYSMFDKAHVVAGISARWPLHPSYMHTFGVTKNYFIIVEQPLSVAIPQMCIKSLMNMPLWGAMKWYENEQTQINVVSRKSGKIAYTFFAKPFFYLHLINQYECSNHIVVDICSYKDPSMIDCMYIEALKDVQSNPDYASMFRSKPIRFVLPLIDSYGGIEVGKNLVKLPKTKAKAFLQKNRRIYVKPEKLCNLGCETPTINYKKYLGTKYRYFYAISADVDAENPGTIIKVDTLRKTTKTWCEDSCYPSEPIFIPSPNSQSEDDGVILSALVWGGADTHHVGLIVLNAKTMQEMGRTEFRTSSPVPKCLHGWFLPNK
uniref:Carotenoid isomerooxygenase n=1 Tax=Photinus pyralis TaxID=7054 RepID=A0A1Y1L6P7_PHOPY